MAVDFLRLFRCSWRSLGCVLVCIVASYALSLALPVAVKLVIDEVLTGKRMQLLPQILLGLTISVILKLVMTYWASFLSMRIVEEVIIDLRTRLYGHALKLAISSLEEMSANTWHYQLTSQLESLKRFLLSGFLDFLCSLVSALFVVGVLFWLDLWLAVWVVLFLPIFLLTYSRLTQKLRFLYENLRVKNSQLSAQIGNVFLGMRTIHVLSRQDYELKRLITSQQEILDTVSQAYRIDARLWAVTDFLMSISLIWLVALGAHRVLMGEMTIGTLMAFYVGMGILFLPLLRLTSFQHAYREARACLDKIQAIFKQDSGSLVVGNFLVSKYLRGKIEFQGVHFSYGQLMVLRDLNLTVEPGQTLAIVGPNGSGKSTLIHLLMRFFDPTQGQILLDGCDLKRLDINQYRLQAATVLQNDFLFRGTVRQNILYGRLEATSFEVEMAANMANIHDFIMHLPKQYESQIEELGNNLSGGQRQQIIIARAFLRNPRILILDEATSAVDSTNEASLIQATKHLMKNRTVLIISHHISTIKQAQKIAVLQSGKIQNSGTHQELIESSSYYRSLLDSSRKFSVYEN